IQKGTNQIQRLKRLRKRRVLIPQWRTGKMSKKNQPLLSQKLQKNRQNQSIQKTQLNQIQKTWKNHKDSIKIRDQKNTRYRNFYTVASIFVWSKGFNFDAAL